MRRSCSTHRRQFLAELGQRIWKMPQTPCFQECFSSAGAFRCCCSVLEKSQLIGVNAEEGYRSAWFSWKMRRKPSSNSWSYEPLFFYINVFGYFACWSLERVDWGTVFLECYFIRTGKAGKVPGGGRRAEDVTWVCVVYSPPCEPQVKHSNALWRTRLRSVM